MTYCIFGTSTSSLGELLLLIMLYLTAYERKMQTAEAAEAPRNCIRSVFAFVDLYGPGAYVPSCRFFFLKILLLYCHGIEQVCFVGNDAGAYLGST
jgi:hypothetical protein